MSKKTSAWTHIFLCWGKRITPKCQLHVKEKKGFSSEQIRLKKVCLTQRLFPKMEHFGVSENMNTTVARAFFFFFFFLIWSDSDYLLDRWCMINGFSLMSQGQDSIEFAFYWCREDWRRIQAGARIVTLVLTPLKIWVIAIDLSMNWLWLKWVAVAESHVVLLQPLCEQRLELVAISYWNLTFTSL